jgi:copper homeostasis protein
MAYTQFCAENFTDIPKVAGKVNDIELCDNLAAGGTTPSYGVIKQTAAYLADSDTTFTTMIRPRGGDFVYNSYEVNMMEDDILKATEAGANAFVLGALTPENEIDEEVMEKLLVATLGMPVTFHMAFDAIEDWKPALDWLVDHEVSKILVHGGPLSEPVNIERVKAIVDYAAGRIQILVGGGVNFSNYEEIVAATGADWAHGTKILEF